MRLDLHIHSTASDGSWSPEAVVRGAAAGRLDVIALADHDTAAGYAVAAAVGRELHVQVIPALEVSSTHQGRDVHILGYFVDPDAPSVRRHGERAIRRRYERMLEMLARLAKQGIEVDYAAVEEAAGADRVVIGRPHLARALVAAGHALSVEDAFDRLIGDDKPAFVPTDLLSPVEAVEVVAGGGGVAIWAHPPGDLVGGLLPALIGGGLRGLEVYRARGPRADVVRYERLCRERGLLMSGGSDWHSPAGGTALGDFFVTADEVEGLLTAGGM
ncbi:MAG TPA: PHP domain-containing protein [Candidatus Limnocylindrales bacterium]|nr:PHP domain-containing protein [Candidatus Limnocylindrales bacterium]